MIEGDILVVSSLDVFESWENTGKESNQSGDFWSFAINGPEVKLTLSAPSGKSSGSAITRASDGKIIGLHHYGGVTATLNSASMMSLICQDAGGLLVCDSN